MGNQKALTAEQSLAARTECSAHTPGPWTLNPYSETERATVMIGPNEIGGMYHGALTDDLGLADARLIAAAPDMLAALVLVRKLIVEAAMTGFNCRDGDWAERLFASQAVTHKAVVKATGAA